MQLHACFLLFIITTDKTLASLQHFHCGGNISLDEEPAGTVNLTLPGRFTETNNHQSDETPSPSVCTWTLGVPQGRTVLLRLGWLETGWSVSVRCVLDLEVLENNTTALLSHCDGNKATITWTGAGRSSRELQLFYYVQEDERNSSENHTSPRSDVSLRPRTETSFTSATLVGQEVVRGTEEDVWSFSDGLERSSGSSPVSPTSPLQGLTVAGRADRETLPLPEEELNNGADTSGAAHKMSAGQRTQPYFQHSTDAPFYTSHREVKSSNEQHSTQMMQTHAVTQASELSSHSVPPLTPTWESGTFPTPHGGAVSGSPGGKPALSWRSQRSTASDLTSAVTSDPSTSPTEPQPEPSSAHTDAEPSASSSTSHSLTTHITAEETDLSVSSHVTSQTAAFESSGTPENTETLHASSSSSQTSSPQSTEGLERSPPPHTSSPFTQTSKDETTRHFTDAIYEADDRTWSFTSSPSFSSSTPVSALTLKGVVHSTAETYTPPSTDSTSSQTAAPPSASTPTPSLPLPSATAASTTTFVDHKTTPTIKWTSSSRPLSTNIPVTQKPHNYITTAHISLLPLTTTKSDYSDGDVEDVEEEDKSLQWFRSSTTTQTPPWTSPHQALTPSDVTWSSTTTQAPKFYIVPDQPAAVRVESIELLLQIIVDESRSTSASGLEEDTSAWVDPFLQKAPGFSRLQGVWSSGHAVQILVEFKTSGALQWLGLTGPTSLLERTGLTQAVIDGRSFRASRIANITLGGVQGDVCHWLLQCPSGYRCVFQPDASNYTCSSVCHFDHCHHHGICTHHQAQLPVCRCLVGEDFWYMGQRCDMRMTRARLVGACLAILLVMVTVIGVLAFVAVRRYRALLIQAKVDQTRSRLVGACLAILLVMVTVIGVLAFVAVRRYRALLIQAKVDQTRSRLVGACLAILLVMVTVIDVLAFVAVRRYRALLIQAKVDQTRSSYRRFNHFDELSGRFWLRSWAGSADSLDNPAFTRSDELLHLRALDRPCCYHDDTLSLASTCPSHGTRINTIYPHSSQYGWRGSEMSVGDGVLDSGKASDLSVCSWPVEPIHWTPFPLLQQLASHRTPTVRVSRPRSYCEGMELVDLGKSWTA